MITKLLSPFSSKLHRLGSSSYSLINRITGGGLDILWKAVVQFNKNQAFEGAASLAFYALFSLFPLLAVIVTGLSFFTDNEQILQTLIRFLIPIFPVSRGLISENLERFIRLRGTIGIFGSLGIIWTASSVFIILTRNINRAWETARVRNFLHTRLLAFGVVGGMLGLLILAQVGSSLLDIVIRKGGSLSGIMNLEILRSYIGSLISGILPSLITFIVFLLFYRYLPATTVRFREAFWGALVVTILWEITSNLFAWYIGSGLVQYDLLYGSLATMTVLMFWFYINSLILIYGAYVSSAIAQHKLEKDAAIPTQTQKETEPPAEEKEISS